MACSLPGDISKATRQRSNTKSRMQKVEADETEYARQLQNRESHETSTPGHPK